MKPITTNRWRQAQSYEQNFWVTHGVMDDFDYYQVFAEELQADLRGLLEVKPETVIMEIGSGAAGILTHLPSRHRYAIDPLEHYYSTVEKFVAVRDPLVQYHDGMGEELPFGDGFFDLVIMDNVLDHCRHPWQVLREIRRVLKPDGVLLFQQNTYHLWGKLVRGMMEWFLIDRGHPFTFTRRELDGQFRELDLRALRFKRTGYLNNWWGDLTAGTRKGLIKALLFATRDRVMWILRKTT